MTRDEINKMVTVKNQLFGATKWNELLVRYVEALEKASHKLDNEEMKPLLDVGARIFARGEDELKRQSDGDGSTS